MQCIQTDSYAKTLVFNFGLKQKQLYLLSITKDMQYGKVHICVTVASHLEFYVITKCKTRTSVLFRTHLFVTIHLLTTRSFDTAWTTRGKE